MGKYFTVSELCRSQVATARNMDNTPPLHAIVSLKALINSVLDPVREIWGRPLTVNSGFRCPALNAVVGGAASSQHIKGEAADITAGSPADNRRLFDMIAANGIVFDQLIDEKGYSWLHVSYSKNNRRQILHL